MKKMMKKYGGVIFFYTAIIVMIWALNYRFASLSQENSSVLVYSEREATQL